MYIAGTLSEKENQEIDLLLQAHPELLEETLSIEKAIVQLTATTKGDYKHDFTSIKNKVSSQETKVIPLSKPKNNWLQYTGWAAAILMGSILAWSLIQNNNLKEEITLEKQQIALEKLQLEEQIDKASSSLAEAEKLITVFRDRDIVTIPLAGQKVSPNSFAKVYWDKKTKAIFLDAKDLPDPPKGKVYQVWSLTLNPLTPTSLGTIDNFTADANKIFNIENPNNSEAFGITLEPEGGSESPNLEQLYTLGAISS